MKTRIFEHQEGCTPFSPCVSCELAAFLKERLKPEDFVEFARQVEKIGEEKTVGISPDLPIEILELNNRVIHVLHFAGIRTVRNLLQLTKEELMALKQMGKISFLHIEEQLRLKDRKIGELAHEVSR